MADPTTVSNTPPPGISVALGFIRTGTAVDGVLELAANGTSRAENVWNSYARDTTKMLASPSAAGAENESVYYSGGSPTRLQEAAFYYAVEQYAGELLRLRIGNVGADPSSPVASMVVKKAMAMIEMASERIAAFEKYCAGEAGVLGAHYQGLLDYAQMVPNTAEATASAFWNGVPHDGATLIEPDADTGSAYDFVSNMALAIGQQMIGANILQRKLGYSGARNPALGGYYLNAGKAMGTQGSDSVSKYVEFCMAERPQHALSYLGL